MIRKLAMMSVLGLIASMSQLEAQNGLGVVGGYVSSNFVVAPVTAGATYSARSGFAGGLSLMMGVADGISIGPELLYVQKGANLSLVSGSLSGSGYAKVGYVEAPLLVRLSLKAGSARIFATAGPQFSYRISCTTSLPAYTGGVIVNNTGDCDQVIASPGGIKDTDFGLMFGGGVAFGRLSLSARYDRSFPNINKDPTAGASTVKNKAILVMAGIALGK